MSFPVSIVSIIGDFGAALRKLVRDLVSARCLFLNSVKELFHIPMKFCLERFSWPIRRCFIILFTQTWLFAPQAGFPVTTLLKVLQILALLEKSDGKWIKLFKCIFCVMGIDGSVIHWRFTRGESFEEVRDLLLLITTFIYIDNTLHY